MEAKVSLFTQKFVALSDGPANCSRLDKVRWSEFLKNVHFLQKISHVSKRVVENLLLCDKST